MHTCASLSTVMAGLDPATQRNRQPTCLETLNHARLGHRVKPGDDAGWWNAQYMHRDFSRNN
jgi:hypothetical protein